MLRHHMRWQAAFAVGRAPADAGGQRRASRPRPVRGPLAMTMGRWLPPFGISFTADALGAGFALVATFVALVCAVFSVRDIDTTGRRYGFYPFLMLMMAGVNGAFLTGDIFNLYVWFEVFLIASFGLLILGSRTRADRRRDQIRDPQPARDGAVPGRHGLSLRRRSARSTWPTSRRRRRPARFRPADDHRRALPAGLRHEGGGLSAQFLASRLLSYAAHRDGGAVRRAVDQDRHLCAAAHAGHDLSRSSGLRCPA